MKLLRILSVLGLALLCGCCSTQKRDDLALSVLHGLGVEFWSIDLEKGARETVSVSLAIKDSNGVIEWIEKDCFLPSDRCSVVVVLGPKDTASGQHSICMQVGGNRGISYTDYPYGWGTATRTPPEKLGAGEYLLQIAEPPTNGYDKKLVLVVNKWPNKSPEPTAVGAGRSAIAVHATSRRWLSFLR
jgi:hypothetical protein